MDDFNICLSSLIIISYQSSSLPVFSHLDAPGSHSQGTVATESAGLAGLLSSSVVVTSSSAITLKISSCSCEEEGPESGECGEGGGVEGVDDDDEAGEGDRASRLLPPRRR